ncbi:MAG: DNA-binding GntR family transcriptional regulator, partial [Kiritimatiellia bacterium]
AELFLALYIDGIFSASHHDRVLTAVEGGDAVAARAAMGDYARSVIPGGDVR